MALCQRQPAAGLIMHTDRGSQYGADSYRQLLTQHGIEPSMSRKGNCWDNAVAESFFHTLKTELVYLEDFDTHEQAQTARDLGVNENTLHTWIGKYHRAERQEPQFQDEHLYEEVKRLRKENTRLKEERDI